jgi:hypothetical protein
MNDDCYFLVQDDLPAPPDSSDPANGLAARMTVFPGCGTRRTHDTIPVLLVVGIH